MDEQLRVSDVEREQAAAALGDHFVAGRLSAEEHAERVDAVWSARTRADLTDLFRDLPVAGGVPAHRPVVSGPAYRRRCLGIPRGWLPLAVAALIVLIATTPLTPGVAVLVAFVVLFARRRWIWTPGLGHRGRPRA
ncbi:DUF1707 domain-containing protein [Nocardioides sp. MAH-18]|uniref:DUF1707 domain-containing protein n=1 Tax=Nocardioides agri TaxID=2682843 RepID=A0A6L6XT60_9ACTN|nr:MULTISPECIES: DUF1707 domain-containing protein [unclassified Nocardioides]MBA2954973.1 DUF1707 domain-containing protein [Nocardioides sp. CGMCC 1.13656]MVQ49827.1 DUF1707 domain-containing protein [Nocardioides sp. MAH-18]